MDGLAHRARYILTASPQPYNCVDLPIGGSPHHTRFIKDSKPTNAQALKIKASQYVLASSPLSPQGHQATAGLASETALVHPMAAKPWMRPNRTEALVPIKG